MFVGKGYKDLGTCIELQSHGNASLHKNCSLDVLSIAWRYTWHALSIHDVLVKGFKVEFIKCIGFMLFKVASSLAIKNIFGAIEESPKRLPRSFSHGNGAMVGRPSHQKGVHIEC